MEDFIAILVMIAFVCFIIAAVTGIIYLIKKKQATKTIKKAFAISGASFLALITVIVIGINKLDEQLSNDPYLDATETADLSNEEPEEIDHYSYDENSAKADKDGNFSLTIKVDNGYEATIDESDDDMGNPTLKKTAEHQYTLTGKVKPDESLGIYRISLNKGDENSSGSVYIDNELVNSPNQAEEVNSEQSNDDNAFDIEYVIEEVMGSTVDWNGKEKDSIRKVEVNDNVGLMDGSKIAILELNEGVGLTSKTTEKQVNQHTLEIIKEIKEDTSLEFDVSSYVFFWYLPLTDDAGNEKGQKAFKIVLEKKTLDSIDYDNLKNVNLPSIADQYDKFFK